jgi:hypothetical protein
LRDEKVFALRRTIENAKANAKADTVRRMQEMLKLEAYLDGDEFAVLVSDVDKIAKELLEET